MARALLVIDVQLDFCPGGALAVPDGHAVVPRCNAAMEHADVVVLTADWHPAGHASFASTHDRPPFSTHTLPYGEQMLWPDHCVQGSRGARFHPDLDTDRADLILRKGAHRGIDSYSAFRENDRTTRTGLAGWLRERGVREVLVAGLATDYCVRWSAEDAVEAGFHVAVLEPAVRGIDPVSVDEAWASLASAGVGRVAHP